MMKFLLILFIACLPIISIHAVGIREMTKSEIENVSKEKGAATTAAGGGGGIRGRHLGHGGLHSGMCCNYSGGSEWVLVDNGHRCWWMRLFSGQCVGGPWSSIDCEGATCGGGFYKIHGIIGSAVCTPFWDDPIASRLRWTPKGCGPWATPPNGICNPVPALPPGYSWGPHPSTTCAPTAAPTKQSPPVMPPTSVSSSSSPAYLVTPGPSPLIIFEEEELTDPVATSIKVTSPPEELLDNADEDSNSNNNNNSPTAASQEAVSWSLLLDQHEAPLIGGNPSTPQNLPPSHGLPAPDFEYDFVVP